VVGVAGSKTGEKQIRKRSERQQQHYKAAGSYSLFMTPPYLSYRPESASACAVFDASSMEGIR